MTWSRCKITRTSRRFWTPGPCSIAIGDPARILSPGSPAELADAIRGVNFAATAFGVDHEWTDRIARYEAMTEVRVREYAAHADDEVIG